MVVGVPEIVLNSGRRMPAIGLGTATFPVPPPETVIAAVLEAIEVGYRHFDTASVYGSERPLGRAIHEALERGLVAGGREELFVTTKLWCTDMLPHRVVPALQESLRNLGLDYVDLFLIHYPARLNGEKTMVFDGDAVNPDVDMKGVWKGMEECQKMGLAKSIGVSNFTRRKLLHLLPTATILPSVNQVEMHPKWQQKQLREFCDDKGIHVSAYSPLGAIGVLWGTNKVLESEEVTSVAQSMARSKAQVCLRWGIEEGASVVVKSFNKERMKENIEIFDWELQWEESKAKLSTLPQERCILAQAFVSPNGPYKSQEEFWDGEI